MKNQLLILLIACSAIVNAQNIFFAPDTNANQIFVNGYGGVGSTGIPQNFMNKFIFPGFIDNDLKDEASNNLDQENLFGGEFLTEIHTYLKPGSLGKNGFWGVGIGTNVEGNLNFTKDLFNLTFYGNKPYAGTTLNLNNTSFKALSYSFVDFTIGNTVKKNKSTMSYWADLGIVLGHSYTNFDLPEASIYTDPLGDYLEITIKDGLLAVSDTLSQDLFQGIGGKMNLNFSYTNENSKLLVQAKNIGGISWNQIRSSKIDTTLRFEGIEINNIFQLSDSVLNEVTSLDSLIDTKKQREFHMLPIDFNVFYSQSIGKITYDVFARYRLFANYNPFVRVGGYYKLPFVTPGITVAYGGYSDLHVGLNTEINIIDALKISIGTNNILGAIVPNSSTALDAYTGIKYNF